MDELPVATHVGELKIRDIVIPCAILEGGQRIITQQGILEALGASIDEVVDSLPARSLKLPQESFRPIRFQIAGRIETGYLAEPLFRLCQAYRDATSNTSACEQQQIADRCKILLRGLALVGITTLIDEATGYQHDKDRQALYVILENYFSKELVSWAKRLPEDFYKHLFRLRRWQYHPLSLKHPRYIGKTVEVLIFKQLPAEVLEELKKKNPEEIETETNTLLEQQIIRVMTLMQVSSNWRGFESLFARAHPKNLVQDRDILRNK